MAIVVEVNGELAEFSHGEWKSSDTKLEERLNLLLDRAWSSPSHPHPEKQVAEKAARALGGTVVSCDDSEAVPGRTY